MKIECHNCHDFYAADKKGMFRPFCSERCETVFLDNAPVELINKVCKPSKKEKDCCNGK